MFREHTVASDRELDHDLELAVAAAVDPSDFPTADLMAAEIMRAIDALEHLPLAPADRPADVKVA